VKAVIFDMDGVIVDSERQWKLCEGDLFRKLVPTWTDADHQKIVGMGVVELYHWLFDEYGIKETKENFLAQCQVLAEEIYGTRVTRTEGITEFMDFLRKSRIKVGLASSSPRQWVNIVLERFMLADQFAAVSSGDETPGKTKPEPDLYLLCAERLGFLPGDCVAIEDSYPGVTAAKAAGMRCAAFRNGHNDEQDLSGADYEFTSFEELTGRFRIRPAARG
jgi:HAD superfamily hydrolase (TIGR01509 family)